MNKVVPGKLDRKDLTFAQQVKKLSGADFDCCYQCMTCSAGCPAAFNMDILPHQLIRKIQNGSKEEVLRSNAIWHCASCETCVTRCPNEINIPSIMDTLRQMTLQTGTPTGDQATPLFHEAFVESIRQWGKVYELGMILDFKSKTMDLFSDIGLGIKMLLKGKFSLFPGRKSGKKEIQVIFRKIREKN
jgi:heterodisulfide reductase subunit C